VAYAHESRCVTCDEPIYYADDAWWHSTTDASHQAAPMPGVEQVRDIRAGSALQHSIPELAELIGTPDHLTVGQEIRTWALDAASQVCAGLGVKAKGVVEIAQEFERYLTDGS